MKKIYMKFTLALAVLMFSATGCTLIEFTNGANTAGGKAEVAGNIADSALTAVEGITGKTIISPETAEKGEAVANKTAAVAAGAQKITEVAGNFLSPDLQPYTSAANAAMGALSALSLAAAGVFAKRKKTAEEVAKAVIVGANDLSGAGSAIKDAALSVGVADAVETLYQKAVESGDITKKSS